MLQNTVWILTLIGMGFITAVYLFVFLQSTQTSDTHVVKAKLYGIRPWWFALLVALIVVALATTLSRMPYADTHGRANSAPDLVVEVTAHQWEWVLSRNEVPVGKDVAFRVNSEDVNHDFALYDEQNRLVLQTQAMPGYTNIIRHTFESPGTYRIRCLEYCGLEHHAMLSNLIVTAHDSQGGIQ